MLSKLEERTSVLEWMLMGRVREGARPLWLECSGDVSTIVSPYICELRVVSTSGVLVFSLLSVVGAACIPMQRTRLKWSD
jgi:hypothetical protein